MRDNKLLEDLKKLKDTITETIRHYNVLKDKAEKQHDFDTMQRVIIKRDELIKVRRDIIRLIVRHSREAGTHGQA